MKLQTLSKFVKATSIFLAVYFISGCIVHVDGKGRTADIELEDTLSLNASGIERIIIEAGAGLLEVTGDDNATEIDVEAHILTTEDRDYKLTLVRNGKDAKLVAIPNTKMWSSWRKSPRIDLKVSLPANLAVDIEDSSGDLIVKNIANRLRVDDSSGNIVIDAIGGPTIVDDSSGNIKINDVEGDIQVDDGSGNIYITATVGDINIEDGSGNIDVIDTDGSVFIDDGSGDIYVKTATGLTITEDGSGKTTIKDVSGKVTNKSDNGDK